jgi:hypothetical protein
VPANVPEDSFCLSRLRGSDCGILGRIANVVLGEETFSGEARFQKPFHFLTRHALRYPHRDDIEGLGSRRRVAGSDPADFRVGIVKLQPGSGFGLQTGCTNVDDASIATHAKPCVHPRSGVGYLPVADLENGHVVVTTRMHMLIMAHDGGWAEPG